MGATRAILRVTSGPNQGDTLSLDVGSCRLVGRHLSDAETAFIDRDGKRLLDASAADILQEHLKERAPEVSPTAEATFNPGAFDRGPDIIFADDSISRAHAMVFFDPGGLGVIDLASTNGTYVDAQRVTSEMLTPGQILTIGNSDLVIELQGD